jgi:hypothetical protein
MISVRSFIIPRKVLTIHTVVTEAQLLLNFAQPIVPEVMNDPAFLLCSVCCEAYHPYCLFAYEYINNDIGNPIPLHESNATIMSPNWRCFNCLNCEVCHLVDPGGDLLTCTRCNEGYHTKCIRKVSNAERLDEVPEGKWLCPKCVICENCGSKCPQGRGNPLQGNTACFTNSISIDSEFRKITVA